MFFETHKIKLETLSEYLKGIRREMRLSLSEVSEQTSIAIKFLKALEEGAYAQLPSEVYAKGFLRQLAKIYGIEQGILIKQFDLEWNIQKNVDARKIDQSKKSNGFFSQLVITPKILSLAGGLLFIVCTVFYIVWQVFAISKPPSLEISSPQDLVVINQSYVNVEGKTDAGATLNINNEPVFVEPDGRFASQIGISAGPKELVIAAKNRFNKSTSKVVTIIGQGAEPQNNEGFGMELDFIDAAEVSLQIDAGEKISAVFYAGETKFIEAKRLVLVSVSNAGAVKVKINGKSMGLLGRAGEQITDIPFSADSGIINVK